MALERRSIINNKNVTGIVTSMFLFLSFNGSKKGMIGNLIGGFVTILVGVSLIGPIAQEINNVANCQASNFSIGSLSTESPEGITNSFGGGGANHFGGYDGEVKHNSFTETLASTSIVKTNKSFINPDCIPLEEGTWGATMLKIVPAFFALGLLAAGLGVAYSGLRNSGMI